MREMIQGPESLTIVRHAVSVYNESKTAREKDPEYRAFKRAYDHDWLSTETRRLAERLRRRLVIPGGESETPILEDLAWQAENTGLYLQETMDSPDVVIVSPYLRTRQTLDRMTRSNVALAFMDPIEDPRIRERDHGIMPEYGDKRIFFVFNPEERAKFEQGEYDYRYPGGENMEYVRLRVADWLKDISRRHYGERILAVTHHETILAMRMVLEGQGREWFMQVDRQDKPINCGVTHYQHDRHGVGFGTGLELEFYNADMFSTRPPLMD